MPTKEKSNQPIPLPKGWNWSDMMLADESTPITNPYTGKTRTLTPLQEAVYSTIMGAEMLGAYDTVRQGIRWYKQYYPDIYMDLLD